MVSAAGLSKMQNCPELQTCFSSACAACQCRVSSLVRPGSGCVNYWSQGRCHLVQSVLGLQPSRGAGVGTGAGLLLPLRRTSVQRNGHVRCRFVSTCTMLSRSWKYVLL